MSTSDYAIAEVTPDGTVWFHHPSEDGRFELPPSEIQRLGLTDMVRVAINDHVEAAGRPVSREPQEGISEATSDPTKPDPRPLDSEGGESAFRDVRLTDAGLQVLGGHTDEWRWQKVYDGGIIWIALDNKPAIQNHDPLDGPPPEFQKVVVPREILELIVR